MKNLILIIATMISFNSFAQTQNIEFGQIDYSGYSNIKFGAFWSTRPEAKMVYEGATNVPGVQIFTLPSDHFVKFAEGNFSNLTRNYIVFPAGSKVYKKNGIFYAAKCGNMIENIVAVNNIKIIYVQTPAAPVLQQPAPAAPVLQQPAPAAPVLQQPAPAAPVVQQVDPCSQGMAMFNQLVGRYQSTNLSYKKALKEFYYLQSQYPCLQGLSIDEVDKTDYLGIANTVLGVGNLGVGIYNAAKPNQNVFITTNTNKPNPTTNQGGAGYIGATAPATNQNTGYIGADAISDYKKNLSGNWQ